MENSETNQNYSFEFEKLQLERERIKLERERLETERLRHNETLKLSNNAAGRVVVPMSNYALSIFVSILLGGTIGAYFVAKEFKPNHEEIAQSVARVINPNDTDGTNAPPANLFRVSGQNSRGRGYLLILD